MILFTLTHLASGADYAKKVYIRRNPKVAEAIAQAEQELDVDELKAFEEKMYGDVWDKEKISELDVRKSYGD